MPVSEDTFRRVALEDGDSTWELHCGYLRRKPGMTAAHNWLMTRLGYLLLSQLDWSRYEVRVNSGHIRRPNGRFYVADVIVVPVALTAERHQRADVLEEYSEPLPLIIEVWSRSTGDYDIDEKLPEYQERQDQEIWRLHPYERTLTAWRLQPDGGYTETVYRSGVVEPVSLPGVRIDLDALFG